MYKTRWRKVKAHLRKEKANAFIFKNPSNIRYLFASHLPHESSLANFLIIFRTGKTVAITSSLEEYRTRQQGVEEAVINTFSSLPHVESHYKTFKAALKKSLGKRNVKKALSDADLKVRGVKIKKDDLLTDLRLIKDDNEIKAIRKACRITDKAAKELPNLIKPGNTERDVHRELNYIMKDEGAHSFAFETSVASGPHSAYPHHDLTNRKFKKGDPVTCDFGAVHNGYCADLTRTYFAGEPNEEFKDIYNAVFEAQKAGIKKTGVGVKLGNVDGACREVIKEYGYAEYYVHSTGHGVGLDVHELPRVSPGVDDRVRKGMVFTIEPGIYIPKKGGVRIEDDIYIGDKVKVLNRAKKPRY